MIPKRLEWHPPARCTEDRYMVRAITSQTPGMNAADAEKTAVNLLEAGYASVGVYRLSKIVERDKKDNR